MEFFDSITALRHYLSRQQMAGKSIGFVPTMGALHNGHLTLISTAKQENDLTVCSIYVNPTQFNNDHDLAVYPRTLEADGQLLQEAGCHVLFAPTDAQMYPQAPVMKFDFGNLERVMEGQFRPGHFNGVGIVVSKLFHIVQPNRAYFGQKDLQQCLIIKRLVQDLSFDLTLRICPTVRETDGLAMSSRNRNLSVEQRKETPFIYQMLQEAKAMLASKKSIAETQSFVYQSFANHPALQLEYFEIAETDTLVPVSEQTANQPLALCIAAFMGKTRLIDNLLL